VNNGTLTRMNRTPRPPVLHRRPIRRPPQGAILLEVVFALALLAAAAGVILGGMTSSIHAAERVRSEADVADVSVTLASRIQMGLVPMEDAQDQAFDDPRFDGWTFSIKATPIDAVTGSDLKHVEVTVTSPDKKVTMRTATLMHAATTGGLNTISAEPIGGGL
jgi:type II secretory pathway pseudopilin PulG